MLLTVSCAAIPGWIVQTYGKLPTVGNVSRYDWSGPIDPDENAPAATDVTLCVTTSLFVQQTVVPEVTFNVGGSNA